MSREREGLVRRLRRAFFDLRTEHAGPGREAAAIGVGLFIGCSPFFGFHLLICWAAGSLLRLNRLQVYLAANISNPVFAPFLILFELQTGALIRHGELQRLTVDAIRGTDPWSLGADYLLGTVIFGALLGGLGAAATYAALRGASKDQAFALLTQRASSRYMSTSITAWEFARGKLRGDPVYRQTLFGNLLSSGDTLLDIGCGQGLMLALLVEARRQANERDALQVPCFDRLIGIELRPRIARLARRALGDEAEILDQDARRVSPGSCSAVLFFDVLHMMPLEDQQALLEATVRALEPGGVILIRDADAGAGWRFTAVRFVNRTKALLTGAFRQQFHFRTRQEWIDCFDRLGLECDLRPMAEGTPFANVMFRLTVH